MAAEASSGRCRGAADRFGDFDVRRRGHQDQPGLRLEMTATDWLGRQKSIRISSNIKIKMQHLGNEGSVHFF